MTKSFAFRADAAIDIGTGHVMRCLTLADALALRGAECHFICREHAGNLIELIRGKGHVVHTLPLVADAGSDSNPNCPGTPATELAHGHWLGSTQAQDAIASSASLARLRPDWLIVDHYALDERWERALKPYCRKLMVIDDLADRPHLCDLLLDQTLGRDPQDYRTRVPTDCHLLCGARYALLRPDFAALRHYSLQRRTIPALRQLLITMGGIDSGNATGQVLEALRSSVLPPDCRITVLMGPAAPWLESVRNQAHHMPWPTRVLVGVNDIARLMADSDLAIGAAGSTSWERCCLGLPSIMLVLAANQRQAARNLEQAGAALLIGREGDFPEHLIECLTRLIKNPGQLQHISRAASKIVDGHGIDAAIQHLMA